LGENLGGKNFATQAHRRDEPTALRVVKNDADKAAPNPNGRRGAKLLQDAAARAP
jgi:hypothetical protein